MPQAVVLFDGVCNLCNGAVQFIIKRDKHNYFHFAALQSDFGQQLMDKHQMDKEVLKTLILKEGDKLYFRSTAALRIARRLKGLWPLMYAFIIVPPFIRNAVYNYIANNRYTWFGKQDNCMIPTPELKARFIA